MVYTAFDVSPNVSLYLMDLKGWAFNSDVDTSHVTWAMSVRPAKYLVANDTSVFRIPALQPFRRNLIGETEGVSIYRLDSSHTRKEAAL